MLLKNTGKDNLQSPTQILSEKRYFVFRAIHFSAKSLHETYPYSTSGLITCFF